MSGKKIHIRERKCTLFLSIVLGLVAALCVGAAVSTYLSEGDSQKTISSAEAQLKSLLDGVQDGTDSYDRLNVAHVNFNSSFNSTKYEATLLCACPSNPLNTDFWQEVWEDRFSWRSRDWQVPDCYAVPKSIGLAGLSLLFTIPLAWWVVRFVFGTVRWLWVSTIGITPSNEANYFFNFRQSVVLFIAILLIVKTGLFPPYVGEYRFDGNVSRAFLGYHYLFSPPTREDVFSEIFGGREPWGVSRRTGAERCSADIAVTRLDVQVGIILIASTGLVFIMRTRKGYARTVEPEKTAV